MIGAEQAESRPAFDGARVGTLHPLVRQYVVGRLNRKEIVNGSGRTQKMVLGQFADVFGRRPVANMSRHDVQRYQETIAHLSVGTRRNRLSVSRSFVRWLQLEGRLKNDPFVGVKFPKPPRRVPRALTRDECDRLWAVLPDLRARAVVSLMLGLGLRRIEVVRAQVADYDPRRRTLQVVGKGSHERLLPVPEHVATVLDELLQSVIHGPMIRTRTGSISHAYVGMLVRGWMTVAGIKKAPWDGKACHALRHTIASEVADIEPDLRVVQEILGHASLANTQIYLRRADIGKMRAAMEAVGSNPSTGLAGRSDRAPSDAAQTLAGDLCRALRAIRDTYADAAAAAALRTRLGEYDEARRINTEITYIEDRALAVIDSDAAWHLVSELANHAALDFALEQHDPERNATAS